MNRVSIRRLRTILVVCGILTLLLGFAAWEIDLLVRKGAQKADEQTLLQQTLNDEGIALHIDVDHDLGLTDTALIDARATITSKFLRHDAAESGYAPRKGQAKFISFDIAAPDFQVVRVYGGAAIISKAAIERSGRIEKTSEWLLTPQHEGRKVVVVAVRSWVSRGRHTVLAEHVSVAHANVLHVRSQFLTAATLVQIFGALATLLGGGTIVSLIALLTQARPQNEFQDRLQAKRDGRRRKVKSNTMADT